MKWEEYYESFYTWSENLQRNRIQSLTDFTYSDEVCEIVENLADEKDASMLVNKALSQGVYFGADEIVAISECVDVETLKLLISLCEESLS